MEVSYFKELYKAKGHIKDIDEVVDDIKSGTHKKPIESIKYFRLKLSAIVDVFQSPKGGLTDYPALMVRSVLRSERKPI